MNKTQLVEAVAGRTGTAVRDTDQVLTALLDAIVSAVADGDTVALPGFGAFEPRTRGARTGRNPQTGEPLEIPASVAPVFRPALAFRKRVATS